MLDAELAMVLDELDIAVMVQDAHGVVQFANRAARSRIGPTEEAIIGAPLPRFAGTLIDIDGNKLETAQLPSIRCRESGQSEQGVVGVEANGSQEREWRQVVAKPFPGRPGWVLASSTDVTAEVLRGLAARHESQVTRNRFERVMGALPGILFQIRGVGPSGVYTFLEGPVREVLGVDPDALRADPLCPGFYPDDLSRLAAAFVKAAENAGAVVEVDYRVLCGQKWQWVRQRCVASWGGADVVWTGFSVDVTDQHDLEERIQRSQRLDAMASLAAGVAHNFNNMLGALLPNIEGALERAPADLQPELREAHQAAQSAAVLVRRLLQAVRGERVDVRRVVDVVEVVRGVAAICRGAFGPGVKVEVSTPPLEALVLGSVDLVQQVVLNLCINARDASTDSVEPTILILVETTARHVRIEVRDNGHGISDEVMEHLGEPFFTTKPPGQGTGLGLATVYGIVADLDGDVSVLTELGVKTTFVVTLPRALDAGWADEPSVPPSSKATGKILLVDDEPLVRSALARVLTRMGHVVVEACDGHEALAKLGDDIDAVLLDLSMPGLGGAETLSAMKARRKDLPIAIITGHLDHQAGVDEADVVLRKPVARERLARFLAKAL